MAGPFQLQQKIDQDVLGELYCAAWRGEDRGEEIGLLRLFAPHALDPDRFEQQIGERRELVGAELSDHLGSCRRLGVVGGRAYDFSSAAFGQSLARLIERSARQRRTVPLEVALFVAGRLGAGLADAYRRECAGEAIVHGYVVPYQVMVTEEGGVRLLGLEVAPALRSFRGTAADLSKILPYLSPESVAEGDSHASDDVYSLGALLYELLTLKPLASASDLRVDNGEIPCELRYLLARSVAPRPLRIQTTVEWLRELKALVVQEGWGASASDLSAYLAEVDERVSPTKPDTTEITAEDREILEQALRRVREVSDHERVSDPSLPAADEADGEVAGNAGKGAAYDTSVMTRDELKPLETEGRLFRTAHVKRATRDLPSSHG